MHSRDLLTAAAGHAADFLATLPEGHVGPRLDLDELRAALAAAARRADRPATVVVDELARAADAGLVRHAGAALLRLRHRRRAAGGDRRRLADRRRGTRTPAALRRRRPPRWSRRWPRAWLLELLGLPAERVVGFVTGCQMANFTCLAAARHARAAPGRLGRRGATGCTARRRCGSLVGERAPRDDRPARCGCSAWAAGARRRSRSTTQGRMRRRRAARRAGRRTTARRSSAPRPAT